MIPADKVLERVHGSQKAHDSLVNACLILLHLRGVPAHKVQQKAARTRDGRWYAASTKGSFDIYGVLQGGRALVVEAKTGQQHMTPEQSLEAKKWRAAGALVLEVHNAAELEALR